MNDIPTMSYREHEFLDAVRKTRKFIEQKMLTNKNLRPRIRKQFGNILHYCRDVAPF